jgi:hypothetical protein
VFSLAQSELNRITRESNIPFMTTLAEFFQVKLVNIIYNSPDFKAPAKGIEFFAQSDRKHYVIASYLAKYPLMSSK